MLHPEAAPRQSYLETTIGSRDGVFVATSDHVRAVPEQLDPWIPGGLFVLGTDGFGRSETRAALRDFFEVDSRFIVLATLYALMQEKQVEPKVVEKAIKDLGINPEKVDPAIS
jgi:pyruvate dehydrogenase E1 component